MPEDMTKDEALGMVEPTPQPEEGDATDPADYEDYDDGLVMDDEPLAPPTQPQEAEDAPEEDSDFTMAELIAYAKESQKQMRAMSEEIAELRAKETAFPEWEDYGRMHPELEGDALRIQYLEEKVAYSDDRQRAARMQVAERELAEQYPRTARVLATMLSKFDLEVDPDDLLKVAPDLERELTAVDNSMLQTREGKLLQRASVAWGEGKLGSARSTREPARPHMSRLAQAKKDWEGDPENPLLIQRLIREERRAKQEWGR